CRTIFVRYCPETMLPSVFRFVSDCNSIIQDSTGHVKYIKIPVCYSFII
ncbi:hypothetical protein RUMCAL_00839, partial [Ruminococcus callidus ATCC 27760]